MRTYMVIEDFSKSSKEAVYERFHTKGRMTPDGLTFVESWLEKHGNRCFQIMQTNDPALFDVWKPYWDDLVDFEIVELGDKPAADAS